jgi:membrane protein DedA with SNARE-associated domain
VEKSSKRRKILLALGGLRAVLGILAIFLAKFLYEDNFLILTLMRPTKEVFLAGAFLAKRGDEPNLLLEVLLAGLPLSIAGVWLSYLLGRQYSEEIGKEELPGVAGRILPVKKIRQLERVLKKKGVKLIFLGRLAAFPSSVIGAAAGSSDLPSKRFLPADGLGALAAIIEVMALGYVLGSFFDKEDPATSWTITGVAVAATFGLLFLAGHYLKRE